MTITTLTRSLFKNIKGILFDKDGTLFDFDSVWSVWCDRVLHDLSDGDDNLANSLAASIGYDNVQRTFTAGSLIVSAAAEDTAQALANRMHGHSLQEVNQLCIKHLENLPLTPVKDLVPVVSGLKSAGFKLGVATNDVESGAASQLAQSHIDQYFDFVCGCDSGFGSKPDAGMILAFCKATDLEPSQIAMVGDSLHDISAGKAAGAGFTIGVLTGPATSPELSSHADLVLDDISGLKVLF